MGFYLKCREVIKCPTICVMITSGKLCCDRQRKNANGNFKYFEKKLVFM